MGGIPLLESFLSGCRCNLLVALVAGRNTPGCTDITVPLLAWVHAPIGIVGFIIDIRLMRLRLELGDILKHSSHPQAGRTALVGALAVGLTALADFAQ
ncbi:hypothetical protein D3C77_585830 [compost metagenome]